MGISLKDHRIFEYPFNCLQAWLMGLILQYRDNLTDAENGNIQLQAQRAFTTRRQISEETENVDNRESSEVEIIF